MRADKTTYIEPNHAEKRAWAALFKLFLTVDLRGQHFARATGAKPSHLASPLFWVYGQCFTLSLATCLFLYSRCDAWFFAAANLTIACVVVASVVAVEFGEAVLHPADLDIIAPLPIRAGLFASARVANLLAYILAVTFSLTIFPATLGSGLADSSAVWLPIYTIGSFSACMLTASLVVIALSLGGSSVIGDRARELLAWVQIVLILVVGYGGQLMLRDTKSTLLVWSSFPPDWIEFVPTVWLSRAIETASLNPSILEGARVSVIAALAALSLCMMLARIRGMYATIAPSSAFITVGRGSWSLTALWTGALSRIMPTGPIRAIYILCCKVASREPSLRLRLILPQATPFAVLAVIFLGGQFSNPFAPGAPSESVILPFLCAWSLPVSMASATLQLAATRHFRGAWSIAVAPVQSRKIAWGASIYLIASVLVPTGSLLLCFAWGWWGSVLPAAAWSIPPLLVASVVPRFLLNARGSPLPLSAPEARGTGFGSISMPFVLIALLSASGLSAILHFRTPTASLLAGVLLATFLGALPSFRRWAS